MEFILFTGYINSGKSTTAKRMCEILQNDGYSVSVMSLATPLKELAGKYFEYNEFEKNERRDILENLATDLKELFGKSLFAYTLLDKCDKLNVDYVIVDDLRYKEEFNVISDFFPTTVIVTPRVDTVRYSNDLLRIDSLLSYFKSIDYQFIQMSDLTDYSIKHILYGIE